MGALPDDVRAATAALHSVTSRRRLLDLGYSPGQIDWWQASGLLDSRCRGQYVVGGSAIEERGRLITALDRCGQGARIGGAWACGLHGLEGFDLSGSEHILIPPTRRVRGAPFLVVRSAVPGVDQATVDDLPTLTVARSLIDVSPARPARTVRLAFDHARREGLTTLAVLTERAEALGRVRGAPEMRALIRSGLLRMESEGERAMHTALWLPGDPLPQPQVWVEVGGRRYRLDFAYLDARLCLEYDGRDDHTAEADRHRDRMRDLALEVDNILTLRITSRMLDDPMRTRAAILAVRRARLELGFPPIVPCRPLG